MPFVKNSFGAASFSARWSGRFSPVQGACVFRHYLSVSAHVHGFPRGASGIVLASIYGYIMGCVRQHAKGIAGADRGPLFADASSIRFSFPPFWQKEHGHKTLPRNQLFTDISRRQTRHPADTLRRPFPFHSRTRRRHRLSLRRACFRSRHRRTCLRRAG